MGFIRQGSSSLAGKARASLLVPLLVLHRTLRGGRAWHRTHTRSLRVLIAIPVLALIWCAGEFMGYWTRRARQALSGVSEVERKRQPFVDAAREPIRRPWLTHDDGSASSLVGR